MVALTLDMLRDAMRGCGVDETVDLDGDIRDTALTDLGYDSLAVLQIITVVARETGVRIDDSAVTGLRTPGAILDQVNGVAVSAP
jgi:minimal PKS acyl carrier protein